MIEPEPESEIPVATSTLNRGCVGDQNPFDVGHSNTSQPGKLTHAALKMSDNPVGDAL